MKVLHLVNDFSHGGAESYVFSLMLESSDEKLNFGVGLLHENDKKINKERVSLLSERGIDVFSCRGSFFLFLKNIKKYSPDIIHCHNLKALIFSVLALVLSGNKHRIVFTQHTSYLKRKIFHRVLHRFVDRYVAICDVAVKDFARVVPDNKIIKLMNGVSRSEPGDLSFRVSGKCNVGMIARFHAVKNHKMLIQAAAILKEKGELDKFQFFLIGDGDEKSNIENMAFENACSESINFLGALSNARNYIDGFDYLLLCSSNEGLPITILEALEKKTPVIATNVGGVPDLILDGSNGFLVKSGDYNGLAETLLKAADPKSFSRFMSHFEKYDFLFSMDKVLQRHFDLYSDVLRG